MAGKKMKCKCGKELIGKEKRYCANCAKKRTDNAKKGIAVGSMILSTLILIVTKGKLTDISKKL